MPEKYVPIQLTNNIPAGIHTEPDDSVLKISRVMEVSIGNLRFVSIVDETEDTLPIYMKYDKYGYLQNVFF